MMIELDNSFVKDISVIKEASEAGKLVLFVGAGVSQNSGIPDWPKLTKELMKDLDGISERENPLKVAQMYFNERKQKEYLDKVSEILKLNQAEENPIHKLLLELKPVHILTTNYDTLLEDSAQKYIYPFSVINSDLALPKSKYGSFIVKVHGDFSDGGHNIVLKEDDYLRYSENYPLTKSFIESVFASKVVLFIGYGYGDDNLKRIINRVWNLLDEDSQRAYLLKTGHVSQVEINYFKEKGINTIQYNEKIDNYLDSKNPHSQPLSKYSKKLQGEGLELFKMLNFVVAFDPSVYQTCKKSNIISQALSALRPLSEELDFIPSFYLQNIYPFNQKKIEWTRGEKYKYNYVNKQFHLETKNPQLLELVKNIRVDEEDVFDHLSQDYLESLLPKSTDPKTRTKSEAAIISDTNELIHTLNRSLILEFPLDSKSSRTKRNSLKVLSSKKDVPEENINFFDFEFSKCYQYLVAQTDKPGSAKELLKRGYFFYQFRDYKQACKEFRESAKRAWIEEKHFIFLIACLNIRRLITPKEDKEKLEKEINELESKIQSEQESNATHESSGHLEQNQIAETKDPEKELEEDKKRLTEIEERLKQIDENNEEINDLLLVSKDIRKTAYALSASVVQRELIRYIIENDIEGNTANSIRETLYDARKSNFPQSHALNRLNEVCYDLKTLNYYYHKNCIVYDHYTNFETIIREGVEAAIAIYAGIQDDSSRTFPEYLLEQAILYLSKKDFRQILNFYKVKKLKLKPEDLNQLIKLSENCLQSAYTTNTFGDPVKNKFNDGKILFSFQDRLRNIIETNLEVLGCIEIPESHFSDGLKAALIHYLQVDGYSDEGSYRRIIGGNSAVFSVPDLEKAIMILLAGIGLYSSLLELVVRLIHEKDENYIIGHPNFEKKFRPFINSDDDNLVAFILYPILNGKLKAEVKKLTKISLEKRFDPELYRAAIIRQVLDPLPFLNQYLDHLVKQVISHSKDHPIVSGFENRSYWNYRLIIEKFNHLLSKSDFNKPIEELKTKSNLFMWLFEPEKFDYSKLKRSWLFFDHTDWFIERMKRVKPMTNRIKELVKEKDDQELANFYVKNFL